MLKYLFRGILIASMLAPAASAARFVPLGDLAGGDFFSQAYSVSADGHVVVGTSHSGLNESQAFRWTEATGMVGLGIISGPFTSNSEAFATNVDGEFVVGIPGAGGGGIWQVQGGGTAVIHQFPYEPRDISPDGGVVVGFGWVANPNPLNSDYVAAFRWTENTGIELLDGGVPYSLAYGISADATTIVGSIQEGPYQAFRWTAASGMVGLGHLPGGETDSYPLSDAYDVSADGSIVVGRSRSEQATGNFVEAFRWTEQGGMVGLGDLPGGVFDSEARGIAADGRVVVGYGTSETGAEAMLWTPSGGMKSVKNHLSQLGIDLADWYLDVAVDVSDDGRVIAGYGRNPQGAVESWIVILPEPTSLTMSMVGLATMVSTLFPRRSALSPRPSITHS